MSSEVHCVLAGARTDLDDVRSVGENLAQHIENRCLVALARFGEWQQHLQRQNIRVTIAEG